MPVRPLKSLSAVHVLVAAFVVLVGILLPTRLAVPPALTFVDDASQYSALATSLVQHGVYALDGVHPFFEREPGYPVFLAALYAVFGVETRGAIYVAQALLVLAGALCLRRELEVLFSRRASLLFLGLVLLHPAVLHVVLTPLREALALALAMFFTAWTLKSVRRGGIGHAVAAGLVLGALILTYAPYLLFPVGFIVVALLIRQKPAHVAVTIVACAAVVGIWGTRNWVQRGEPCLTGCYRSALQWYVRGEQAETIRGSEPFFCLYAEYVTRNREGLDPNCHFNAVWRRQWPNGMQFVPEDRNVGKAGQQKILANFSHYLWFSVFEVAELHLPYVNGWGRTYNLAATAFTALSYLGVLLWAVFRAWRRELLLPLSLMAYTTALFALTDALPRYLMPVVFCYAWLASIGYDRLIRKLWKR